MTNTTVLFIVPPQQVSKGEEGGKVLIKGGGLGVFASLPFPC